MTKPTKAEILQALEDLEEGRPISADMKAALNQYELDRTNAELVKRAKEVEFQARASYQASVLPLLEDIQKLLDLNPTAGSNVKDSCSNNKS